MKITNVDPPGDRALGSARGRNSTIKATSRGVRIIDRSGRDVEPVTTLRVPWVQELEDDEAELGTEVGQPYTNDTGASLEIGTVVVIDGTNVILTTTPQDTRPVGVVIVAGDDGNDVVVQTAGKVDLVAVTASVTANNFAETSTTAGAATENASRRAGSFAVFLTSGTSPSALLFGMPDSVTGSAGGGTPWLYAQADGGLAGDGVTDDTVALQALIDTATANGTQSGWIWFEPGTYLISGALQDTGAFNGQILLPDLSAGGSPGITITFQGPVRPYWHGYPEGDDGEAVLKSTLTGGTGSAAVISGGNMAGINRISVVVRNLRCVAPADPTLTFWNLSRTYEGKRDGVLGTSDGSLTQPTSNAFAYFIRFPASSIGSKQIEDVFAIGFYGGFEVGELSYGYLNAWYCAQGVVLRAAGHLSVLHIETLNCPYHIVVNGGDTYTAIVHDAENRGTGQPAWSATVAHLYDPSDLLHGPVQWTTVDSGIGPSHDYIIDGGANVLAWEVGAKPDAADAETINGVSITGTPSVGQVPTATSATAATWQTPSTSGGTGGPLLIADDHSTPIVFADLLLTEDGDDLLYADSW